MDIVPFVEGDVPVADDRGNSSNSLTVFQQPQSAVRSPAPRGSGRNRSDMEIVPVADDRSNSSNSLTVFQQPQPAGRSTAPRGRGRSKSIQNENISSQSETRAIQLAGVSLAPRGRGHNKSVQNESVSSQSETRAIQLAGVSPAPRGRGRSKSIQNESVSSQSETRAIQLAGVPFAPKGRGRSKSIQNESVSSQSETRAIQLAGGSPAPKGRGRNRSVPNESVSSQSENRTIQLAGSPAPKGRGRNRSVPNESVSSQSETRAIQLAGVSPAPRGTGNGKLAPNKAIQLAGRSTAPRGRETKRLATNASISSQNKATTAIQLAGRSTAPRGKEPKRLATNASISSQNKATKAIQLAGRSTSPRGKGSSKNNATREIQLAGRSTAPRGREPKKLATNASISSQNKATKAIQLAGRSTAPRGRETKRLATNASISSQNKATKAIQLAGRSTAPRGREPKRLATNASLSLQNKATKAIQLVGRSTSPRGRGLKRLAQSRSISPQNIAAKKIQSACLSTGPIGRGHKRLVPNGRISPQNIATTEVQSAGLSTAPSGRGHKRSVPNGCILPQNSATRAKQSAGQSSLQSNYVEPSQAWHPVSSNTMFPISADDIVAVERVGGRVNGKGLLIHPSSHGLNGGTIHNNINNNNRALSSSSRNRVLDLSNNNNLDARAQQLKADEILARELQEQLHHVDIFEDPGIGERLARELRHTDGLSNISIDSHRISHPSYAGHSVSSNTLSPIRVDDIVTGLNRGSIHTHDRAPSSLSRSSVLDPEVVELVLDDNNNNLDTRARQLEEDEILARQLQEQYRGDVFEDRWVDEPLARELQHEEGLPHTSTGVHNISHPSHAGDSVSRNVISPISADDALAVEIGGDRVKQHGLNGGAIVTNNRASSSLPQIRILDPEVVELVSPTGFPNRLSEDLNDNNNNLDARARQLKEDEILARELQEEQYRGHIFEDRGIDEPLVRELHREEGLPHTFADDIIAEERGGGRVKENELLIHPSSHGLNGGTIVTNNRLSEDLNDNNIDLDARARQLEEDEILARELQEQYRGDIFEDRGVGEPLGRELQHAEDLRLTSTDGHHISHPSHAGVSISSNMMSPISVDDIVAEERGGGRVKGKGLLIHPSSHGLNGGNILTRNRASSSSSRGNGLDPEVVELVELDNNENNNLNARGRQLEADERLAHELHEQQYRGHLFEGRGIDEHLAWELPHAEGLLPTSISSHNISHPTFVPRANRLPRSQPHQNASNRRTVPQVPFSTRMSQSGSRMTNRLSTPITSSRGRHPQFPQDMDLDMDFEEDEEDFAEDLEEDGEDFAEEDEEDFAADLEEDGEDFAEEDEEDGEDFAEEDEENEEDSEEDFEEDEEDFEEDAEDFEEDMETDHIVDVLDTPDITNDGNNDHKNVGNPRKRKKVFPVDEISNCSNATTMSPSQKPYPSQNAPIFRRAKTENVCGLGTTDSNGAERMEKGKTTSSRSPSKSHHCVPSSVIDLTAENGQFQRPEPDFSHCGSRDNGIEVKKEAKACFGDSSTTSKNAFTGKCKLEEPDFSHCGSRDNGIEVKKEAKACFGDSSTTSKNAFTGECKLEEPDFSHCGSRDNAIKVKKEAKACFGDSSTTSKNGFTGECKLEEPDFSHCGSRDNGIEVKKEAKACFGDSSTTSKNAFTGECILEEPDFSHCGSRDNAIKVKKEAKACFGNSSTTSKNDFTGKCKLEEPDFSHCGSSDNAIEVKKEAKACLGNSSITVGDLVTAVTVVKLEDRTLPVPNTIGDQEVVKLLPPPKFVKGLSEDLEASRFLSKSHHCGPSSVIDLTVENGQLLQPEPDFSHSGSKDTAIEVRKEAKACLGNSSITFGDQVTAVTVVKLEDRTLPVPNTIGDQEVVKLLPPPKFVNGLSEDLEASRFPFKSHQCGPSSVIDLTVENGQFQLPKPDFSHCGSRDNAIEMKKETKACLGNSSIIFGDQLTAVTVVKLEDRTLPVPNTIGDLEVVKLLPPPKFVNRLSEDLEASRFPFKSHQCGPSSVIDLTVENGQFQQPEPDFSHCGSRDNAIEMKKETKACFGSSSTTSKNAFTGKCKLEDTTLPVPNTIGNQEVVELLSPPRFVNRLSEDLEDNDNKSLDARARQLKTDEILARELQEQLYHDDIFEHNGIGEHVAWEQQHTERLDVLEAVEDAVGDLNDMGMADDIFHAHHDFNENDYEMLSALDEQNHQHTGASANQINSLPQSTIQTDNFTEGCAICLETPVKGEIIRHLPCLHKFHKNCIDPWLHRKTSCPVCKSYIT